MKLTLNMYRQFLAAATGSLSTMACGMCFTWVTQMLVRLLGPDSEVPMTPEQSSWIISGIDLGDIVISLPAGIVVNKIGRKICVLITGPIFLFTWFLAVYIRTFKSLFACRIIQGLAYGLVYAALPVYITEISSPEIRGMVSNLFTNSLYFGFVLEFFIGSFLNYTNSILVTAVIPALFTVFFFLQPESPYYYLMKGNREEAVKSLAWLRRKRPEDVTEELEEIAGSVEEEMANKTSWTALFTRLVDRRGFFISQLVGGVSVCSGAYVILGYSTQLFTDTNQTALSPEWLTIIIGLVMFVSSFFSSNFIDRSGRKPIVIISTVGCGLCQLCISIYFYLDKEADIDVSNFSFFPPLAAIIFSMFYSFGLDPVTSAFRTELSPIDTRGASAGMCSLNFAVGSFIVVKMYQPIADYVGVYFNFLLYSGICFFGAILMYFFVIETKGKSLAEVQEILRELCEKRKKDKANNYQMHGV